MTSTDTPPPPTSIYHLHPNIIKPLRPYQTMNIPYPFIKGSKLIISWVSGEGVEEENYYGVLLPLLLEVLGVPIWNKYDNEKAKK